MHADRWCSTVLTIQICMVNAIEVHLQPCEKVAMYMQKVDSTSSRDDRIDFKKVVEMRRQSVSTSHPKPPPSPSSMRTPLRQDLVSMLHYPYRLPALSTIDEPPVLTVPLSRTIRPPVSNAADPPLW